jgi:putative membrane protein
MMYRYFNNGNFGDGNFGNGNFGYGRCLGLGAFHGGWILLIIGILIILALLFFFLVHNRKKKIVGNEAVEILKMKYVKGEITEEEYFRRREVVEKN